MLRWLEPGLELKRWIAMIALGAVAFAFGTVPFFEIYVPRVVWSIPGWWLFAGLGFGAMSLGVGGLMYSIASRVHTGRSSIYQKLRRSSRLRKGPRIVAIGGGTGLSTLLRGLKRVTANLTAVVAVTDDGGSSGRLRQEFDVPAPGDLRNCLVALAPEEERLSSLMSYRFEEGEGLEGHTVGNILLAALTELNGGFPEAIRECSEVLAIEGRVTPAMLGSPQLRGTMEDGSQCRGETSIAHSRKAIRNLEIDAERVLANPEAVGAVADAELIVVGPGSLYTSILTNFLEPQLCQTFVSSEAPKVYVCNLMTQPGETDGFTASDHLRLFKEIPPFPIRFDHVLVNTRRAPREIRQNYAEEGSEQVVFDFDKVKEYCSSVHAGDFLAVGDHLRHDVEAICSELESIFQEHIRRRDT